MDCLHSSTILIALWNIIYSILQTIIFVWQINYVKKRQWEFENRQVSMDERLTGFQARFPGLYGILTETPERRRINALFALAITLLIIALFHLILSIMLFYGAVTKRINFIWPWFFMALPQIVLSTIYAVIWWIGDIFDTQLMVSVVEFVFAVAINSICFVIALLFFVRIKKSTKSKNSLKNMNNFKNSFTNISENKILPRKNNGNIEGSKKFTSQKRMMVKQKDQQSCRLLYNSYKRMSSLPKDCSKQLPLTSDRLAAHNRLFSDQT